jgi:hypothetical protein
MQQTNAKRQALGFSLEECSQIPNWMNFYARELIPFDCPPITIDTFLVESAALGDKFCVLLDEFVADGWSIYLRNLARAVGLPCIVSNTNTNIANLASRGSDVNNCWSLVCSRLDNVDLCVIRMERVIAAVKERANFANNDTLFDSLFRDWLCKSRPGVAVWVKNALISVCEQLDSGIFDRIYPDRTVGNVLQAVLSKVSAFLSTASPK